MIPAQAVEAATDALVASKLGDHPGINGEEFVEAAMAALEAAAPYMLAELEREVTEAKRVIALLLLEAGGKVAISRRAIAELPDDTVIETTQDIINGGWVIRARAAAERTPYMLNTEGEK